MSSKNKRVVQGEGATGNQRIGVYAGGIEMQKTVELIIRHYVGANGNVRDLSTEQLREIETAAQVDRWEIEAKTQEEYAMKIMNRFTGDEILDTGDADLCGANLRGADLRGADLWDADLCDADLCGADLWDADLCGANLRGANLRGANLRDANLRDANLRGADLWDADLCDADLCGADLCGANLWGCAGNRGEIKSLFISAVYPITYTSTHLQIGCERHKIADWWGFSDDTIAGMDSGALEWWETNKDSIRSAIEAYPATPTGRESE